MARHPDLEEDRTPYWIDRIENHKTNLVIDSVSIDLTLECRTCGVRGPKEIIMQPNPWEGERERHYHIGCHGCGIHVFDLVIHEKAAFAICYNPSHPVRGRIDNHKMRTRNRY